MFGSKTNDDEWFKIFKKKYLKGKIDDPYNNLFYYFEYIVNRPYIDEKKWKGHYNLIYSADSAGFLEELTNDLYFTLPMNLYENFSAAVKEYKDLTKGLDCDDLEWEMELKFMASLKNFDDYTNKNYQDIEEILKKHLESKGK